jgi:ABC-type uncharacterized transport system permease subunit
MQADAGISSSLVLVLQALILFSIAANFLSAIRIRLPAIGHTPATPEAEAAVAKASELETDALHDEHAGPT